MKKQLILFLAILCILSLSLSGCFRGKNQNGGGGKTQTIVLEFYGLYDSEDVYAPIIEAYEKAHNVDIQYKKFTDVNQYFDLIVNEMAEGEGPDIFMMHNSWFPKEYKKILPVPMEIANPEVFKDLFVDVAADDLIFGNTSGQAQVWGLPLYVDSLALYYNKEHLEEVVPNRGRPGDQWSQVEQAASLLNRENQSFSRFERSGIAMGRLDNVLRGYELLLALMLQNGVEFYTEDGSAAAFKNSPLAAEIFEFYTSFADPSNKNYSWNEVTADPKSAEKELTAFAEGRLSMMAGFSFTYEEIVNEINRLKRTGKATIAVRNIGVQELPQIIDADSSKDTKKTYASYFVPVVARTTGNSAQAWDFLATMVTEPNLRAYSSITHRTSARRSLINEEKSDPIYGVFANQVGYAKSILMPDADHIEAYLVNLVDLVLENKLTPQNAVKNFAEEIQSLIPSNGLRPAVVE